MKLIKINFIIFIQIIELLKAIQSDHVQVMYCEEKQECLENIDQRLLEIIRENMVNSTQPCEHFWDYACGSWTAAPYYDHVDNFGAISNYYADKLIETLNELQHDCIGENQNITDLVNQITKYFLSCRNIESYYLPMSPYLKELPVHKIFGDSFKWSQVFGAEGNIWKNFNWLKAVAYLRKYGFKDIFLLESIGFAWNDSLQYVVELKIPHANGNFENKYKVLQIMEEFDLIFAHNNTKNYLKLALELYEFDKDLFGLYTKYEHKKRDHFILLEDLPYLVPAIDWNLYFELLLNQELPPETPIEFSGDLNYFHDLQELIQQTPSKIVGSYVFIRFCQYLMDIRPLITDRECLLHTNVMFPLGVNFIYDRFVYKNRVKDEIILNNIFSELKQEFSKNIQANKFSLTSQEQQYLQDKLKLMQLKIGNLPLHNEDINHYYADVHLIKNNFHYNHLEMLKFRTLQQHRALLNPSLELVNTDTYYVNDDISQLRNAPYFVHQRNMLIMPMLFLQLPFYHYAQHPVLQYSLVGWIMAHELSHAFDAHGLFFDAWGNVNLMGLQLAHKTSYISSVDCLIKYIPTISLNERMADVNGLQLVWQTFAHRIPQYDHVYGDLSLKKLFFINFAQFFCGSLPQPISHDRDDVRVRQSVANIQEFAEVFQCSGEAKENPAEKCNIWIK
ncbi:neprilysin-4 [Lucilia cuprina]|uniref:neprilysin-4 n=1 Tax=Lucilia cuprina TaxID=7375 RepID=UPI001F052D29|nr:neprilysin-4 [Lucilia cuprina]